MEPQQLPQISVSGRIVIEGQIPASGSASPENVLAPPSPTWWRCWKWSLWRDHQKLTAYATLLLAIGTIALAMFNLRQIFDFRDQGQRQLRAYVFAVPGDVFNISDGRYPEPYTLIRNSGQTFAEGVTRYIGAKVSAALSPEQEASLGPGAGENGALVLSPKGADDVVIRKAPTILATGQADQILHEKLRLYVFGRIEYMDVFGNSHWTEFCHIYYGEMQNWPQNGGMGFNSTQAHYCTNHNSTDRN